MASFYLLLALLLCILTKFQVNSSGVLVLEDGYTVTTILDGNKLNINPHSVLPQFGSSDLIVLDSSRSTFYTLSLATPEGVMVKKLAGSGGAGYADGEVGSAVFNKPRSFAVDFKGNLYFADKFNHTIRKISKSGVTTIAGGYSQKAGKGDGPAQDASFSDDLELAFVPQMCALIISDHGNKLVRQINLKAEDCSHGSQSVMGKASVMALGIGLSSLAGLIIGFVLRPYVTSRGEWMLKSCNKTWRHCLTSLGRQLMMLCFDMKSVVVSSTVYLSLRRFIVLSLSMLSLMLRIKPVVESQAYKKPVTLLDLDHKPVEPQTYLKPVTLLELENLGISDRAMSRVSQLKDMISFDDGMVSSEETTGHIDDESKKSDLSAVCYSKVDALIEAHVKGFEAQPNETLLHDHLDRDSSLVRRRY